MSQNRFENIMDLLNETLDLATPSQIVQDLEEIERKIRIEKTCRYVNVDEAKRLKKSQDVHVGDYFQIENNNHIFIVTSTK